MGSTKFIYKLYASAFRTGSTVDMVISSQDGGGGRGRGGSLFYMGYIGMYGLKGYGFSVVLVKTRALRF